VYRSLQIGDLCIGIKNKSQPKSTPRAPSWTSAGNFNNISLWISEPNELWNGYPCHWQENQENLVILLGDLYSGQVTDLLDNPEVNYRKMPSLSGHFLIVQINKITESIHLYSNRFGTLHGYIAHNSSLLFSTHLFSLCQKKNLDHIDTKALQHFFQCGMFPDDSTYIKDIKLIPPASALSFQSNQWVKAKYWNWNYSTPVNFSERDWLQKFDYRLSELHTAGNFAKKKILPLSGGLDSRTLYASWTKNKAENISLLSYGYSKNSIEIRIAKQLAQTRHNPIYTQTIQPYFNTDLDRIILAVEGFQDASLCRQAALDGRFTSPETRIAGGHWGDVWLDNMYSPHLENNSLSHILLKKLYRPELGWLLEKACFKSENTDERLEEWTEQNIKNYLHIKDTDFLLKAFKTDYWSHRWTCASLRMYQSKIFPILPFYDNQISDLVLETPAQAHKNRGLQIQYLCSYHPDLAKILWQDANLNLFQVTKPNLKNTLIHYLNRLLKKTLYLEKIKRNYEIQLLEPVTQSWIRNYLINSKYTGILYNRTDVEQLLREFYNNPQEQKKGYIVSTLLTLYKTLDYIVDDN